MTDLKPNDHARLRRALRFLDDQAPLGPDLPELGTTVSPKENKRRSNPVLVAVGTLLATLLLFVPVTLFVVGQDAAPPAQSPAGASDNPDSAEAGNILASGDNWTVEAWHSGSELCYRTTVETSYTEIKETHSRGCQPPSGFSIPNVVDVYVATAYESDTLVYEEILGLVTERADSIVITFQSGDTIEVEPGETVRHGYRGFGITDLDAPQLGEPATIEVFDGETSLGIYSHQTGQPIN